MKYSLLILIFITFNCSECIFDGSECSVYNIAYHDLVNNYGMSAEESCLAAQGLVDEEETFSCSSFMGGPTTCITNRDDCEITYE